MSFHKYFQVEILYLNYLNYENVINYSRYTLVWL